MKDNENVHPFQIFLKALDLVWELDGVKFELQNTGFNIGFYHKFNLSVSSTFYLTLVCLVQQM